MVVICNSERDFSLSRLFQGDAFVFGKSHMLVRADYIALTDKTGLFYIVRQQDIVWPTVMTGATHVVNILAFASVRQLEVAAACPRFDARRTGTLAFRNLSFELRLGTLPFVRTMYGEQNVQLSCA
ncbi:hypothetical protein YOLOSWAG_282 [Erwinia phage vB_EamM_Yoloswag]|uniref:Uncharacterized protein n=1 Tax=Erwinia phage vB_EamM_Yoloswag TaxID=1958956 RepID=A0A1S6L3J7_9CAUD|nr:hypothetical protein HOR66_gp282 [Erwinia phage vB_EamM_Yoloswag]AQT28753.1 hypothetical protein YOLOSWAG_282 [Erwinia phage vB_EamM_Yoloswag]